MEVSNQRSKAAMEFTWNSGFRRVYIVGERSGWNQIVDNRVVIQFHNGREPVKRSETGQRTIRNWLIVDRGSVFGQTRR
jgi:hypothetical protein